MLIQIPVAVGELVDKITILDIKSKKIKNEEALKNINIELTMLKNFNYESKFYDELFEVNQKIWNVEDAIRIKEKKNEFDKEFIELARSVYILNDKRYLIKKNINNEFNSDIIEEKSY